jgi:hypothetical protein
VEFVMAGGHLSSVVAAQPAAGSIGHPPQRRAAPADAGPRCGARAPDLPGIR